VRLQKLVLESCDLCLVRFADGLYERGQDFSSKEVVPRHDFTTFWHGGRNEAKIRISKFRGRKWSGEG
jgi:hypothetical protein